ncbi:hypothetical protein L6452_40129 [Arctium lappa]|uniref:Uncharacterized protein n=1 Tax=Arctium lappa TaxID=4217 RepID=A0ACB8XLV1_ARCLA|nr:hypothetical protein L6452_40129 [Arctium lappa]
MATTNRPSAALVATRLGSLRRNREILEAKVLNYVIAPFTIEYEWSIGADWACFGVFPGLFEVQENKNPMRIWEVCAENVGFRHFDCFGLGKSKESFCAIWGFWKDCGNSKAKRETLTQCGNKKINNVIGNPTDAFRTLRDLKLLRHIRHENVTGLKDVMFPIYRNSFKDEYLVYDLWIPIFIILSSSHTRSRMITANSSCFRVVVQGEGPSPHYGHVMDLVGQRYLVTVSGNDGTFSGIILNSMLLFPGYSDGYELLF